MEWKVCPYCCNPITYVPSIHHHAYLCENCDEVYFEQRLVYVCGDCGAKHAVSYDLVTLEYYRVGREKEIEVPCQECLKRWQDEGQ